MNGAGTPVVSSLSGAWKRDGPVDDQARPGRPPDPQNWQWTSRRIVQVKAVTGGTSGAPVTSITGVAIVP